MSELKYFLAEIVYKFWNYIIYFYLQSSIHGLSKDKSFDINCFFWPFDFKRYIGISFHFFDFFKAYKSFIFWSFDFNRYSGISFHHLNFKKGDHSPNCITILIITTSDLLSYCFDYLTTFITNIIYYENETI